MTEISEKTIDIRNVLADKMGSKSGMVPTFVVKWLEKIIHQDEVNAFLWESRGTTGVEWLEECVKFLDMTLELEGEENIPPAEDGRYYTFVSNHPLGGQDGVALGALIGRHYGNNFKYLVNDLLMNLPGLAPLCIPINKTGSQSRNFPAMVNAGFSGNNHIIMFPAGLCSRKTNGLIHDLPWKKTFISKSIQTKRDVVPIHFSGHNSERFYRVANICKALRLKVNVAMVFLVDEMFRNRHKTFKVSFGTPIPWQTFDKTRTPAQWAQYVQDIVYKM